MTTPAPITDEALAEIKAGLEGVTPGAWRTPGANVPWVVRVGGDDYGSVQVAECGDYRDKEIAPYNMPRWLADAAHIARMDPATVAAMIARIEATEAASAEWAAAYTTARSQYRKMRDAHDATLARVKRLDKLLCVLHSLEARWGAIANNKDNPAAWMQCAEELCRARTELGGYNA